MCVCVCVNLSCCWLKLMCWGYSTFREGKGGRRRRRRRRRRGSGVAALGNDRFAFQTGVYWFSPVHSHTNTESRCMKNTQSCKRTVARSHTEWNTAVNWASRVGGGGGADTLSVSQFLLGGTQSEVRVSRVSSVMKCAALVDARIRRSSTIFGTAGKTWHNIERISLKVFFY